MTRTRMLYNSGHVLTPAELDAALPRRGGMSRQDRRMVGGILLAMVLVAGMLLLRGMEVTPPSAVPSPAPVGVPAAPTTPGTEDFLRAASVVCATDLAYYQAMAPSARRTEVFVACVRAYLAREGMTLP